MKKYLIRKHCEASITITSAQNREQNYYYGKGQGFLSKHAIPTSDEIGFFGFNSIEEAMPRFEEMTKKAEAESKRGYWNVSVTIEEFYV